MAAPKYDHHVRLTPENSAIGNFPAQKAPILTIKSGDTVRFDTGGGAGWNRDKIDPNVWLKEHGVPITADDPTVRETIEVLAKTQRYAGIEGGHLLVGPVAIEGAMPGDSIEVRVHSVVPRIPYGTTGRTPGRGLKQVPENERPPAKVTVMDLKRNVALFAPGVEVPLGPFMGVMALLPPTSDGENRRSGPPGLFAGNLDFKELVDGSTLYIPVFHPGGLFYTGDAHAAQGDGEISGTAIETANTAVLQFILHKGMTLERAARRNRHALHRDWARSRSRWRDADGLRPNRRVARGAQGFRRAHHHTAREHRHRLPDHADRRRHEGRARDDPEELLHQRQGRLLVQTVAQITSIARAAAAM